jgi:hypothetical protein
MAKAGKGPLPDGPTVASSAEAEASPATLAFGTTAQAAGNLTPATVTGFPEYTVAPTPAAAAALRSAAEVEAAAQAAKAPKKPSARASELGIMQQIARRMKKLPSDAARARVAGWFAEEFGAEKGGEPS